MEPSRVNETLMNNMSIDKRLAAMAEKLFTSSLSLEEKEQLAEALSSIADDEEVMFTKEDYMFEDEDDINNDGKVTSREFGFNWLKHIKNGD